jgi:UDP-N-acetylmuramate dehydrogenase
VIATDLINSIHDIVKGTCLIDEPLYKHTSLNIGGNVKIWIEPRDIEDLRNILKGIHENRLTWYVIGNGSNILAGENNLPDIVIKLINFNSISVKDNLIKAESGVSLAKLTGFAIEHGLTGLEFLAGIPGLVGGAIKGNAGAHGRSIADVLEEITVMDYNGEVFKISRKNINYEYRKSNLGDGLIILDCFLNLVSGDKEKMQDLVKTYLTKRKEFFPSEPNAGSIFKNPKNERAGEIIDRLGLKGFKIGNAMVSHQHANMIINTGGAKANDARELIKYIRDVVYKEKGILLETEIVFIGD